MQGRNALCENDVYDIMILYNTRIKNIFMTVLTKLACVIISSKNKQVELYNYKVKKITKVVDGDTIDVIIDLGYKISVDTRVRLLGIDAPEIRTKNPEEKSKGIEAANFLRAFLDGYTEHDQVILQSKKLDGFGRSLGHIFLNGENLSDIMLINGHAVSR